MDRFLARLDVWQQIHPHERITSASFPGADKIHSNTFNGYPVTDGEPSAKLASGQALQI